MYLIECRPCILPKVKFELTCQPLTKAKWRYQTTDQIKNQRKLWICCHQNCGVSGNHMGGKPTKESPKSQEPRTELEKGLYPRAGRNEKHWGSACMCAKSLKSCLTVCDPMDWNPPGSSIHWILPARILEWVAMPSSRESSNPQIKPMSPASSALQADSTTEPLGKCTEGEEWTKRSRRFQC